MSVEDGLVITIPRWFNKNKISEVLERKRNWIEKTSKKLEELKPTTELPLEVSLKAIGRSYQVLYRPTTAKNVAVNEVGDELIVCGRVSSKKLCRQELTKWVNKKAKEELIEITEEISSEIGISYNKLTIRNQKSRWGSCSSKKNISLNQKLLFLPSELARYIIIHELCHIIHLNHSARFWNLVEKYVPNYRELNKISRKDSWRKHVPRWSL